MTVRTRFAPSPTGRLHLGHAYAAWVAHELARANGGEFILRHEDIDGTRVRPEFYEEVEADLLWLGLGWPGFPLRQTNRTGAYAEALGALRTQDAVYPCFCTRRQIQEELSRMAGAPQGPEGPVYPGTCRRLSAAERAERLASGVPHSWRIDARQASERAGTLAFSDLAHGRATVDPDLLGDVILARKDIGVAYHLAVVIDDAFQKITHVTRGGDLLPSTHVHRLLQALLELPEPVYYHHPLVTDPAGKRLAKRDAAASLVSLREKGLGPAEVLALARRGMPPVPPISPPTGSP